MSHLDFSRSCPIYEERTYRFGQTPEGDTERAKCQRGNAQIWLVQNHLPMSSNGFWVIQDPIFTTTKNCFAKAQNHDFSFYLNPKVYPTICPTQGPVWHKLMEENVVFDKRITFPMMWVEWYNFLIQPQINVSTMQWLHMVQGWCGLNIFLVNCLCIYNWFFIQIKYFQLTHSCEFSFYLK